MKKVLEVLGRLDRAGQETFIMNVFRNIDKQKYQISFSVNTAYKGVYEDEVTSLGGEIFHNPYSAKLQNIRRYLKAFRAFLRENGPFDVVHCHTYFFGGFIMWAAYKEGVPIRIMHSHSTTDGYKNTLYRNTYRWVTRWMIKKYATEYVACGKDAYETFFQESCPSNERILNNSIELSKFADNGKDAEEYRHELNLSNETSVFISVARFNYVKNHEKIIEIFNEYIQSYNPNSVLLLVGDGELKTNIEQMAIKLNIANKVRFLGVRSDVHNLLKISDVFLMPSRWEGLPVSLVEAQAAGVRCVISDVITDEIDMGLGLIFKCQLSQTAYHWSTECEKAISTSRPNYTTRKNIISQNGYSMESVLGKLERLYG